MFSLTNFQDLSNNFSIFKHSATFDINFITIQAFFML